MDSKFEKKKFDLITHKDVENVENPKLVGKL